MFAINCGSIKNNKKKTLQIRLRISYQKAQITFQHSLPSHLMAVVFLIIYLCMHAGRLTRNNAFLILLSELAGLFGSSQPSLFRT